MTIYVVKMNEWGCRLYSGAGNLLIFVSFSDKNTGMRVICGAGYSLENTVYGGAGNLLTFVSFFG